MPCGGGHRPLTTDHWEAAQNRPLPGYFAKSRLPLSSKSLSRCRPLSNARPSLFQDPCFLVDGTRSHQSQGPTRRCLRTLRGSRGIESARSSKHEAWRPPHQPQLAQVWSCPSCHPAPSSPGHHPAIPSIPQLRRVVGARLRCVPPPSMRVAQPWFSGPLLPPFSPPSPLELCTQFDTLLPLSRSVSLEEKTWESEYHLPPWPPFFFLS